MRRYISAESAMIRFGLKSELEPENPFHVVRNPNREVAMFGKKKNIRPVVSASDLARAAYGAAAAVALMEKIEPPPMPPEPPAPKRPEPIAIEVLDSDALAEYVAVADSIGFSNPALARARLLNFLQREEIPVYDNDRVASFMGELVDKINSERKRGDRDIVWAWRAIVNGSRSLVSGWSHNGMISQHEYERAVPLDALKTVSKIRGEFPEARFYVTDYESVRPDPFLCVMLDGCEHVVIAVWDEPDFKLTKRA